MNEDNILPEDFDGVFRFTNFTEDDFRARWDGIEYLFPALKTTPMIIPGASPEQVQNIRKKFARELAVTEFYKTEKFATLNQHNPGGVPALYTDSDLTPHIQRCLEPLPVGQLKAKRLPKNSEETFRKDEKGNNVSQVLDKEDSLIAKTGTTITE